MLACIPTDVFLDNIFKTISKKVHYMARGIHKTIELVHTGGS